MFRPSTAFSIAKLRTKAYWNCNQHFSSSLANKNNCLSALSYKPRNFRKKDQIAPIHLMTNPDPINSIKSTRNFKNNKSIKNIKSIKSIKESQDCPNSMTFNEFNDTQRQRQKKLNSNNLMNRLNCKNSQFRIHSQFQSRDTSRLIKEEGSNPDNKGIEDKSTSQCLKNLNDLNDIKNHKNYQNFPNFKNYKNYNSYKNFENYKNLKDLNRYTQALKLKRKRNSLNINFQRTDPRNAFMVNDTPNNKAITNTNKIDENFKNFKKLKKLKIVKNYCSYRSFNSIKFNQMNTDIITQRKNFQSNQFKMFGISPLCDSESKKINPYSIDQISPIIITQNQIRRLPNIRNLPFVCTIPTSEAICILKKKKIYKF